ncbi:hypothetical protein FRB96_006941 [Tulasnella sp. 330]|nr:hypothetical protein FRB96_006941 [Tulasnella sp. 330]KAG8876557.1 hypothetical protein FRB97_004110 [Tulasnella sp. 331]
MIVPSETSKTGTAPSGSQISASKYNASETGAPVEVGQSPPSYDDANIIRAPIPGPMANGVGTRSRVNHIYIKELNRSVKEEWTIDPTIRVPSSLLAPLEKGEERANLRVHAQNGSVQVKVKLISNQPTKSFLYASSMNGSVVLKILSQVNQRFKLKLQAQNGGVTAQIPSDFEGPLTFQIKNGSLKFSEAVLRRVAHQSQSETAGKAFIGDWSTSGYAGLGDEVEAWGGDEIILSAENGVIKIEYADESPEGALAGGVLKYFWRRLMGDPEPPVMGDRQN